MANTELFDRYSLLHLASGFIAKKVGFSFSITLLGSILFEIIETKVKISHPDIFPNPSPDSTINQVGDTFAVMAGWYLA